jgi:ParB-like chromosome segregation protein Spo0J
MNAPLLPGRIEHRPLARLKPYARNAKTHDADQVAKIAASMAEFGWTVPVLVAADGELIAGHDHVQAAAHLGLSEVPVTQIVAAKRAGRRRFAMELDAVYCDVTVLRWEMATGRVAKLLAV